MVGELEKIEEKVIIHEASSLTEATNLINYYKNIDLIFLNTPRNSSLPLDNLPFNNQIVKNVPIIILMNSKFTNKLNTNNHKVCRGYITKYCSKQQLLICIKTVLSGNTYISPELLSQINSDGSQDLFDGSEKNSNILDTLSHRQREILKLLGQGFSNKKIAQSCKISEGTVKLHVSSILKLLAATNRTQAVIKANKLKNG